jgi:hypothetical protein
VTAVAADKANMATIALRMIDLLCLTSKSRVALI